MIRIGAILLSIVLIIAGSVYVGIRWDDADKANGEAETLQRILDADRSTGDADDNRDWVFNVVDWLLSED